MKVIFVCSPLRGDVEGNTRRAQRYCRFVYSQGAVPFAPHLIFPQFLDDEIPEERYAGIMLGLELLKRADEIWLFGSRLTEGMIAELQAARELGTPERYFDQLCEEREAISIHETVL